MVGAMEHLDGAGVCEHGAERRPCSGKMWHKFWIYSYTEARFQMPEVSMQGFFAHWQHSEAAVCTIQHAVLTRALDAHRCASAAPGRR